MSGADNQGGLFLEDAECSLLDHLVENRSSATLSACASIFNRRI